MNTLQRHILSHMWVTCRSPLIVVENLMEVFLYGGGITVKDTGGYVNAIQSFLVKHFNASPLPTHESLKRNPLKLLE